MTTVDISVSNIGGIDELERSFEAGTTLIAGPNASNKTSLLTAVAFAVGAESVPLRSGAEEGRVELTIGDRTVERTARREGDRVITEGDPWISNPEDATLVERFATLLEDNALRTAVASDGDVGDLLKEPMNVDALEAERAALLERKRDLSADLEKLSTVDERLADRRQELESQRAHIAELEETLEDLYDRREDADDADGELQELREERADLVSQRERQADQVADLEDAVERLESRLAEVESDLEAARERAERHDVEALRSERSRIEDELSEVTDRIDVLGSVLTANRELLRSPHADALGGESGLLDDERVCWTCGTTVEESAIEDTVERLADLLDRDKRTKAEYEPELEDLTERIEAGQEAARRVDALEADRRELQSRLENRRESLDHNREALASTRERIEALEARIEAAEAEQSSTQTDVAAEIESTRVDIETTRRDIEQLEAACEELRKQQAERDRLESELSEVTDEVTRLTERIEGIEDHLREAFNGAMADLIEELSFDRIERVWLDGEFDLVVARSVDGTVREDSLDTLAESERAMIGLVLGLAGYLTYDVEDVVPVLLIDSLGAFDAERADRLLEYFADRTELLLAAVHPNMAEELSATVVTFGTRARP